MNRRLLPALILPALCWFHNPAAAAPTPVLSQQAIYDKIDRVLVTVEYQARMTFMGESDDIEGRVIGLRVGSEGVIIFDGTTLGTGSHFGSDAMGSPRVEKPSLLKVTDYQGKTYDAEFIGVDPYSSIAFCRLPDSVRSAVDGVTLEEANLTLGEEVFFFWMLPENFQPRFQMARTVITAVLRQPEKYYLTGELVMEFVMSPVVTADGRLLGVVTPLSQSAADISSFDNSGALGPPMGIMPLEQLDKLLAKPPQAGTTSRGWLGITLQALDPDIAAFWNIAVTGGIIISNVLPRSPAEKAGLKPGDFLVALDGKPLEIKKDANLTVFQKAVSEMGAGTSLALTILRPQESRVDTLQLHAVLDEAPMSAADALSYEDKNFDLTVRDMVFSDYNILNLDPDKIKGVMIDKLEQGGWAAVGGLRPGDIIMKINDRTVTSANDCRPIFAEVEQAKGREVIFMVWRANKTQFVNIKTHWE